MRDQQIDIIKSIINNPTNYTPRRFTLIDKPKLNNNMALDTNNININHKPRVSMKDHHSENNPLGIIDKNLFKNQSNIHNNPTPESFNTSSNSFKNNFTKINFNYNNLNNSLPFDYSTAYNQQQNQFFQSNMNQYPNYNLSNMYPESMLNYFQSFNNYNVMNNNCYNPKIASGNQAFIINNKKSKTPVKRVSVNKFDLLNSNKKVNNAVKDLKVKNSISPSAKKLELTNADIYTNIIHSKNQNDSTQPTKHENRKSVVNTPIGDESNITKPNVITNNKSIRYSVVGNSLLNHQNNVIKTNNSNMSNINEKDIHNKIKNNSNTSNTKDIPTNNNMYSLNLTDSKRLSTSQNFIQNNIPQNNNNYFYNPFTPQVKNPHHYPSISSANFNLNNNFNFQPNNQRSSIMSNNCYSENLSMLNNNNKPNLNVGNNFYNPDNSLFQGRMKSRTQYNNKKVNKIAESNKIHNFDISELSAKQNLLLQRQSKISAQDQLGSGHKKMSFLSYGDEMNLINEFNKNLKFMPDQSRRSSLNFLSLLKSGADISKYRKSTISLDIENGFMKDYETNIEKSHNINYHYENNDIISVYFHMKFLRLLELPDEYKDNFIEGIMTRDIKSNIEKFKEKNIIIRNRAKTQLLNTRVFRRNYFL